jgi:hypothetical protein
VEHNASRACGCRAPAALAACAVKRGATGPPLRWLLLRRAAHGHDEAQGLTPLLAACLLGEHEAIAPLVHAGADVHAAARPAPGGHPSDIGGRPSDIVGFRPLTLAALGGHWRCVDMLLRLGVPVEQTTEDGQLTALQVRVCGGGCE